jgi:hypothetical protein
MSEEFDEALYRARYRRADILDELKYRVRYRIVSSTRLKGDNWHAMDLAAQEIERLRSRVAELEDNGFDDMEEVG